MVSSCRNIVYALLHQREHVGRESIWHAETREIGLECNFGIRFLRLDFGDYWRAYLVQIVFEFLGIFKTANMVNGFNFAI